MLSWAGLSIVLWAQGSLHPGDFLGLRQSRLYARGITYTQPEFKTPGPYRYLRHPSMFGFLLALWATPKASAGYLLFAGALTAYVVCAIRWEEADLTRSHGDTYESYKASVPKLIPGITNRPENSRSEPRPPVRHPT